MLRNYYLTRNASFDKITKTHREFKMRLVIDHTDSCAIEQSSYSYTVTTPTGVEFVGTQYSPSICWQTKTEILDGLLFFLCLRPGDTDQEYFDRYTPEQLVWAQSWECEIVASELPED